jgi:elongation factor Tu
MAQKRLVVLATVEFLTTAEGGRRSAVSTGYRPQFFFNGVDYDCEIDFGSDAAVTPGDTVEARIRLSENASAALADQMTEGVNFSLREGVRTVARGIVAGG